MGDHRAGLHPLRRFSKVVGAQGHKIHIQTGVRTLFGGGGVLSSEFGTPEESIEKPYPIMEAIPEEETLKQQISQLQMESDVFDRIVYKNKNQHRRTPYFQRLLRVRRDLHLLKSTGLEGILKTAYTAIQGKQPKQKVYILERMKHDDGYHGKHTFLDRLLGIARLLSQMVEPILKASIEISSLLAMSFFMSFALTALALLARLRVLLQQMLLDVVCIFNAVSFLAKKEQSFQISHERVKVFRDFYTADKEYLALECVWEGDKFCLLEGSIRSAGKSITQELTVERENLVGASDIHYETMDLLLGDVPANGENAKVEQAAGDQPSFGPKKLCSGSGSGLQSGNPCSVADKDKKMPLTRSSPPANELIPQGVVSQAISPPISIMSPGTDVRQEVAFLKIPCIQRSSKPKKSIVDDSDFHGGLGVKKHASPQGQSADDTEEKRKPKKARGNDQVFDTNEPSRNPKESDDYFFNLLSAGSMKNSLL